MTIRVHISQEFFGDAIKVFIVRHADYGRYVLHYQNDGRVLSWDELPAEGEALTEEPDPTVELPGEVGRALLDELVRYYQGAEDTRTLRRDYDAERKRVDEQAKVIADVTRILALKDTQESPHVRST